MAAAVTDVSWPLRVALALTCAAGFECGALAADSPPVAGLVVAGACVTQVPFTIRGARIAMMLPVVTALGASSVGTQEHTTTALWLFAGSLAMAVFAATLKLRLAPKPTSRVEAWRHSGATAIVAGSGFALARVLEVGHGYWLVLAAASVLAVSHDATGQAAAQRVAGTLSGVLLAVLAVATLALPLVLVLAATALVLSLAWTMSQDLRLATAGASAAAVLIGSGGLVGTSAGLAVERLVLTVLGAGLAAAVAAVLWRLDASGRSQHRPTLPEHS